LAIFRTVFSESRGLETYFCSIVEQLPMPSPTTVPSRSRRQRMT
jgi:hypothetical protein